MVHYKVIYFNARGPAEILRHQARSMKITAYQLTCGQSIKQRTK
uniref:GST N-terminal domain-containing protein n=1 Tax=Heterorhabditis bacteriophora TaxID=37862 RepID=A0A1I7XEG6_HETBA